MPLVVSIPTGPRASFNHQNQKTKMTELATRQATKKHTQIYNRGPTPPPPVFNSPYNTPPSSHQKSKSFPKKHELIPPEEHSIIDLTTPAPDRHQPSTLNFITSPSVVQLGLPSSTWKSLFSNKTHPFNFNSNILTHNLTSKDIKDILGSSQQVSNNNSYLDNQVENSLALMFHCVAVYCHNRPYTLDSEISDRTTLLTQLNVISKSLIALPRYLTSDRPIRYKYLGSVELSEHKHEKDDQ
ncbi:hypothetical protein CROQUDRAFT_671164 [Cronartium quercuum f. sp. fusiforme G11]|uniref:Uncharacterized protein n=1 Tax=Cronartium quercuum f. sp. fusiforme G11 TaxID=708437 RepID=A0A9P6NLV5_9BASI|nr:hypothetical protein CROQUDRAFT_671164 [Cronartium quercuum f. sp. fusiforme G11]